MTEHLWIRGWFLFILVGLLCCSCGFSQENRQTREMLPSIPAELSGLRNLTAWKISQPNWPDQPAQACNITDLARYERIRWDHELSPAVDDKTATRRVAQLDDQVVRYLRVRAWPALNMGPHSGIPDTKRCYRKKSVLVQIYKTTARCTMNSPCTAFDGFAITFYIPHRNR